MLKSNSELKNLFSCNNSKITPVLRDCKTFSCNSMSDSSFILMLLHSNPSLKNSWTYSTLLDGFIAYLRKSVIDLYGLSFSWNSSQSLGCSSQGLKQFAELNFDLSSTISRHCRILDNLSRTVETSFC